MDAPGDELYYCGGRGGSTVLGGRSKASYGEDVSGRYLYFFNFFAKKDDVEIHFSLSLL